jgi:hypothetical protein
VFFLCFGNEQTNKQTCLQEVKNNRRFLATKREAGRKQGQRDKTPEEQKISKSQIFLHIYSL